MFSSSFFDAELVGGAYDRVYAASNFAEYFASFIANGVFPNPATNLQIVANTTPNMTVLASAGLGWINGYYCKNSNPYPMAIAAASGSQARIDSIMLKWDKAARNITTYVKMGTPSANPQPPAVERTPDVYELMLATVLVGAGVTKIVQGNITDKRADTSVCGYVHGVVDQIDTTDLFAQYDEAFQTWFADIQAQLSGDIATNLQNQINKLKTNKVEVLDKATTSEAQQAETDSKWMTPSKTKALIDYRIPTQAVAEAGTDNINLMTPLRVKQAIAANSSLVSLKKGAANAFDIGGITLLAEKYPNTIVDMLPCTGGVYSPTSFASLFSQLGYDYGATIPSPSVSRLRTDSTRILTVDPVTGYVYVTVGGVIYVYNSSGSLIRQTTPNPSYVNYCTGLSAYNNIVAAWMASGGDQKVPCVSLDAGLTWYTTTAITMGNAGNAVACCITSDRVYFGSNYSGNYGQGYFTISTKTWYNGPASGWGNSYKQSLASNGENIAFLSESNTIKRTTDGVNWSDTGLRLNNNSQTLVVNGFYLYFVNDIGNLVRVNISTLTLEIISNMAPIPGLRDVLAVTAYRGDIILLLQTYTDNWGYSLYVLYNGDIDRCHVVTPPSYSPTNRLTALWGSSTTFYVYDLNTQKITTTARFNFQVPTISIPGAAAYIRYAANKG